MITKKSLNRNLDEISFIGDGKHVTLVFSYDTLVAVASPIKKLIFASDAVCKKYRVAKRHVNFYQEHIGVKESKMISDLELGKLADIGISEYTSSNQKNV